MSWKSGAVYHQQRGLFELKFLGRCYRITFPQYQVTCLDRQETPLVTQILLLHYLYHARGVPLAKRWISFRELPGGDIYIGPFTQRAITPLLRVFGSRPEAFSEAALRLGGETQSLGDISFTIPALPMVPVTLVLWAGDDEFPPTANILFDATGNEYLPTEDFAVLSGMVIREMQKFDEACNK
ncbi:hypothetical protein SY88_03240 [Clostridiales bacterium PH28_bin88]|nr:hypothetical protein SY88_03240 [Clostridiales bacterium PH28_bin88]